MNRSKAERTFELLRNVLGAEIIEVRDRNSGRIVWRKSQVSGCGYQSDGIDSERKQESDTEQGDQQ